MTERMTEEQLKNLEDAYFVSAVQREEAHIWPAMLAEACREIRACWREREHWKDGWVEVAKRCGTSFIKGIVGLAAVHRDASLADKRGAFRRAIRHAKASQINASQPVTIKVACNSNNPFPASGSPLSSAESALWAAEQTSAMVTVGDHSGTYPVATWLERGGFNRDSLDALRNAGQAAEVEARIAESGLTNIRLEPFDTVEGTGAHLTKPDYPYQYRFTPVIAPGAVRWRGDLSDEELELLGPDVGLMNLTFAVEPGTYFVNVARISHHVLGGISYCMKALVGILDRQSRIRMHFVLPPKNVFQLHDNPFKVPQLRIVAEIALGRCPELNVIDASKLQLNFGPDAGETYDLKHHLFLASTDIVAIDAVALGIHRWAYQQHRRDKGPLPFAYSHLDEGTSVWDHEMIRHGGRIGLGARTGTGVCLASDAVDRDVGRFGELYDYIVASVLGASPSGA